MLFSKDLLFLHVPKTGSMSITEYLLRVLPPPVWYATHAHDGEIPEGVELLPGKRHEHLAEALEVVSRYGFKLKSFPMVLAAIRNPYSLEVSRYAYLQAGHAHDAGADQDLAMSSDFETFAIETPYWGGYGTTIEGYFTVDGKEPKKLRVIRYENLADDTRDALASIGVESDLPFPWENRSRHDSWVSYYTPAAEQAVYERYKWVFDRGWYERLDPAALSRDEPEWGHKVPLEGPVKQVGPSDGMWPDLWVGGRLTFRVKAEGPVQTMRIQGWRPKDRGPELPLKVLVDGREAASATLESGWFEWEVPVGAAEGAPVDIEVLSDETFCPARLEDTPDERELVFKLSEIGFTSDVAVAGA